MSNRNSTVISWSTEEFEKFVELVKPHALLYNLQDTSRKSILARESKWEQIAKELTKPVEECKKRWRALRDGYMKSLNLGETWTGKSKIRMFNKLEFLRPYSHNAMNEEHYDEPELEETSKQEEVTEQVITDNQEYYEITLVDGQDHKNSIPKLLIPQLQTEEPPKKIGRKNCGRKKSMPPPVGLTPIKILPKPIQLMNGPKLIQYVEEAPKIVQQTIQPQQVQSKPQLNRSEVLDSLIEKVLKEHTNEIDVFFRSMSESVKKLQPSLIPKVKMEVCNVIAKYEMQNFDNKNGGSF